MPSRRRTARSWPNPAVGELRTTLTPHAVVTLLYGTHDTAHNHAQLVAEALGA